MKLLKAKNVGFIDIADKSKCHQVGIIDLDPLPISIHTDPEKPPSYFSYIMGYLLPVSIPRLLKNPRVISTYI